MSIFSDILNSSTLFAFHDNEAEIVRYFVQIKCMENKSEVYRSFVQVLIKPYPEISDKTGGCATLMEQSGPSKP